MKYKYLLLPIPLLLAMGCANINYTTPTGEQFSYSRLGTQKISGFEMTKSKEGLVMVKFENQEGTGGDVAEAMKNMSEVMVNAIKNVP